MLHCTGSIASQDGGSCRGVGIDDSTLFTIDHISSMAASGNVFRSKSNDPDEFEVLMKMGGYSMLSLLTYLEMYTLRHDARL